MTETSSLSHPLISREVTRLEALSEDASGLSARPEGVARPGTAGEVSEILRHCSASGLAVTPLGLQSSTTGASVVERGIALDLTGLSRLLDIDRKRKVARVQPGLVLGELKRQVLEAGLFYPPDPTSVEECTVGGSIATNASGPATLKYGSTNRYVRSLEVILASGEQVRLQRKDLEKNAAGYRPFLNPCDLFVGSEGTLGVIVEAELDLLEPPESLFGLLIFFPSLESALDFVIQSRRTPGLKPRCMELLDSRALAIFRGQASPMELPASAGAALYMEQECSSDEEPAWLERYWQALESSEAGSAEPLVLQTAREFQEIRRLRHSVPSTMIERGRRATARGGRRVSTDFAVPYPVLPELFAAARSILDRHGIEVWVAYGHIGNGHPHVNLIAEDFPQLTRCLKAADELISVALELGGTVSAEHGIGKLKRDYLVRQYPAIILQGMQALKHALDPKGVLAPGNIFP